MFLNKDSFIYRRINYVASNEIAVTSHSGNCTTMRFLTRHTSRRKISTETICLVALFRRGLLRAPFSVAVLSPCELIREDVSPLGKRSFRECSTMPFLLRRDFRVLYARTSTHRHAPPPLPKPILFPFYTFVCSSLVDYHIRSAVARYVNVSFCARENAFVI